MRRIREDPPVDINHPIVDANRVARQPDAALEVPHLRGLFDLIPASGPVKNDNIASRYTAETGDAQMRDANRREGYSERSRAAVDKFIDEEEVTDLDRVFHRAGRHLERRHYKAVDEEHNTRNQGNLFHEASDTFS